MVVLGLSVRLSWYPMWLCGCSSCCDCDGCTVVRVACVFDGRVRGCAADGNAGVEDGGGLAVVSVGHVGYTRSSRIVYIAADVLGMSVVRGMRGVGGVCGMCMCLARSGVGGEE